MMNDYTVLKIRDLENERLSRTIIAVKMEEASASERPKARRVIGPALRFTGRTLRRVGEGIEGWAPASERDSPLGARRRAG